jgi:Zn-dependent M28 family amino/carboxypeptidase
VLLTVPGGSAQIGVQAGVQAGVQTGALGVREAALTAVPGPLADKYRGNADRIIDAAMKDNDGYAALTHLTDHIGKRLSGSSELNVAIDWAAGLMRSAGLQNVRVQPVMVPHWVRGNESGSIVAPVTKPLHLLGLGMSIATPKEGITAQVVYVASFAALDALKPEQIKGKIVVFNPGWHGYGVNSQYRTAGPSRAAAKGAVAVLVRSATDLDLQIPHTGTLRYDPAAPRVPAAAISVEDALMIERLAKEGAVSVHLQMGAHMEPDVQAGNVIGELVGSVHPEQVVVLGGHIDSWDVGQGAQDDGSGIMATFAAVSLIHKLGLQPKRTIRLVFWVNEENGGAGGRAYRELVGNSIADQVAAIEMDSGAETPLGMGYGSFGDRPRRPQRPGVGMLTAAPAEPDSTFDLTSLSPAEQQSFATLRDIASLLAAIGADTVASGGGGSDIAPICADGVPALAPRTTGTHYFDWHHTEADTLDKVDPTDFKKNAAMLAVVTYILADMDGRLAGQKGMVHE